MQWQSHNSPDLTKVEGLAETMMPFIEDTLRKCKQEKELFSICENGILYKLLKCVRSEIACVIQDKTDLTTTTTTTTMTTKTTTTPTTSEIARVIQDNTGPAIKFTIQNIIEAVQEGSRGVRELFEGVWDLVLIGWLVG